MPRLPRPPGLDPRRPVEVAGGLLAANVGDVANIFLMALFLPLLLTHWEALALLPSLAALRGAIATSMASRVSTALHLGVLEPRTRGILEVEASRFLALAGISSIYAGTVAAIASHGDPGAFIAIAFLSALMASLALAPSAAFLSAAGYRRGVDPDSFLAPVLTIIGDLTTVPTLLAAVLLVGASGIDPLAAALGFTYASLAYALYLARVDRGHRRVLAESTATIILVGAMEAGTGSLLVAYSGALAALGVLHAVPSIMEDVGAAASVLASKFTTLLHLEGPGRAVSYLPAKILETLAGSMPALGTLTLIAYYTAPLAGVEPRLDELAGIIIVGGLAMITLYSLIAAGLAYASYRARLDPDNVVIPILTALVDLLTVPFIVLVAG